MLIFAAILFILIIVFYAFLFNSLTSSRQDVNESWADIDVQLKRRHDLIPNLIDTVKGYASHEKAIFEQTAEVRSKAIGLNPDDITQKSTVENELASRVRQIFAVAESYPDLKASDSFQKLQKELVDTEDEIASARRIYNDNVKNYNVKVSTFPTNLVAKINNFSLSNFFQIQ